MSIALKFTYGRDRRESRAYGWGVWYDCRQRKNADTTAKPRGKKTMNLPRVCRFIPCFVLWPCANTQRTEQENSREHNHLHYISLVGRVEVKRKVPRSSGGELNHEIYIYASYDVPSYALRLSIYGKMYVIGACTCGPSKDKAEVLEVLHMCPSRATCGVRISLFGS
jgi:hypothetical protein